MRIPLLSAICSVLLITSTRGEWKPAAGPLMTRWAKDVSPETVHPDYPRPQMVRKDWKNLNGLWQLAFAKEGEDPPVGKELNEQILVPFPVESALSGVMKRADRLWYRRTFSVPPEWKGKRVLLHFGAVDWETKVWVNGKKLGEHRGGYDPFSFDITAALKPEGEQELIVGVWDPTDKGTQPRGKQVTNPRGIYYTPTTGIWQTVWLEPVPESRIERIEIVPTLDRIVVKTGVHRAENLDEAPDVRVTVLEGNKVIATGEKIFCKSLELAIPEPKLWSPESPHLYDIRVELLVGKKVIDAVQSYCGLRQVSLGKDDRGVTRILLNGKPFFGVGPLDQGFWPDGLYTAPTDEALKYDIEITKKLGFNMTRKHVKVEPARWYYWCDKLGLVVWQDMPSGDKSVAPNKGEITRTPESAKQYEDELRSMIDNLHSHPSIVMWVVFNEGWGQFDTKRITEWTKKHDPTRLADCASGWNDMSVGDVHDIHVYPGPGAPPLEESRAAVLGEFGGLGLGVDGHTWSKQTWGYRGTASQEDLTRKYERLLREAWRLNEEKGLSAAVYTQITDVETEANGLLTYDRAVIKMDLDRAAAANRGDFSKVPDLQVVVPTSKEEGQKWRYTLEKPADGWFKPDFDVSGWAEGVGGFGTEGTPGAVVRTEWKTADIWLHRDIDLAQGPFDGLSLSIHHDEDVEVYLNGVLATKLPGFITDYEDAAISPEALKSLKPRKNVIAVHCKQTGGGQYIDVGLVGVKKK
jgi:Glycosyl hydrolases family 2, TIM barrel domain/Glycosyl hydrolases family 2, sugar binding domain/Glycosyl hydrolases family 2